MTATTELLDEIADELETCINDPDWFNTQFLERPEYWSAQKAICASVAQYRVTVVYSGNMVGKDYVVGGMPHWWLYTRPDSLVIVTGPSQTTLGTVTWKEIRRAAKSAPIPLGGRITLGAKSSPLQVEVGDDGWQALGYSTTSVERASGQHAEDLLVIVEEGSGVEDEIWDAIESLGYNRLLVIGNPIRAEGRFVDMIHKAAKDKAENVPKHKAVNAIRIKSTESPHAHLDVSPVGLADKTWLESVASLYGTSSLWYKSHVLAEIPVVSFDALLPVTWLDAAYCSPVNPHSLGLPGIGTHPECSNRRLSVDLAEGVGRDSSCLLVRDNLGVRECVYGALIGLPEAAQQMRDLGTKWNIPAERMSYDVLGIGRKFPNHLVKHELEKARPYAGSGHPRDRSFSNLRSEAAWRLRCRLDPQHVPDMRKPHGGQLPFTFCPGAYKQRLRDELKPLTYELHGTQTKLMDKDDWKEVLGFSPDVADALIQSFAY